MIDLTENRVTTTESRFAASLNQLLQQNRRKADMGRTVNVRLAQLTTWPLSLARDGPERKARVSDRAPAEAIGRQPHRDQQN
jgi:hypothetical protein